MKAPPPSNARHQARRAHACRACSAQPCPPAVACLRLLCTTLTNRRDILCWEVQFAEGALKPRRIFRISFTWLRCFTQVVAQGRCGCALQDVDEQRLRAILLKPWSGVESVELRVREGKEHTVDAHSGRWN